MSREIKFRAWNDVLNEMIKILYLDLSKKKTVGYAGFPELRDDCLPYSTLMQFTGLKDKNGKEIYEGDIVKDASLIDVVVFENGSFIAVDCKKCKIIDDWDECNFEVIGNIYENPELLDANQDVQAHKNETGDNDESKI